MDQQNRFAPFVVLLILAVLFQGAFIAIDCQQTPAKVAIQFTKDFYYLNGDMQNYLCDALAADGAVVSDYLYKKQMEASQRGLSANYLRHMFTHIHVETISQNDTSAKLHIKGTTRVAINPVFMVIGKLFRLADDYSMEATIELVKQKDGWRVCGAPFGLASES